MSEFEPRTVGSAPVAQGTEVVQLIKKPSQPGRFIPFIKNDPIKELVEELP